MTKILLHSCCAPCSAAILEWLMSNGYEPSIFFYNPNIYPEEEYLKRKKELVRYAAVLGIEIFDADEPWKAQHEGWQSCARALKDEPERGSRCQECFRYRLETVAAFAEDKGFPLFTTSLASSRWKSIDQIFKAGHEAASRHPGTKFFDKNWRKGGLYERRNELARQFYNQKYCGCEYSMPESLTNLKLRLKYLARKCSPESTARFFKTGKGAYAENEVFTGVKVPQLREIAAQHYSLDLQDLQELIQDPIHELRFIALLILIRQYEELWKKKTGSVSTSANTAEDLKRERKKFLDFYLKNTAFVNNWDLVDLSSHKILGHYALEYPEGTELIYRLSSSRDLWEQRIGIVSNWTLIKQGILDPIYKIVTDICETAQHQNQKPHDLIQKACGWMLREAGKKDEARLRNYLQKNESLLPRTTFRYASERLH